MPWSNFSFSEADVFWVREAWAESTDKYAVTHTHTLVCLFAGLSGFLSVSLPDRLPVLLAVLLSERFVFLRL